MSQYCCRHRHLVLVECARLREPGEHCRMTTVARLREALAEHFGEAAARTALMRLREHGLLPAGTPGRQGSAEVSTRDAALALIALASPCAPIEAPAVAERLSAYRLKAMFLPVVGPAF